MAEFFDVGYSRALRWARCPEADARLAALTDPDRGFDAIAIGSSERAFHGNQFTVMAPLFEHCGVGVWIPELGGCVDPKIVGHEELMVLLGILAKREVTRARIRVRSAMTVQTRDQGRYLGGRPPYGYRLVDVGPHPNWSFARRGMPAAAGRRPDRAVDLLPAHGDHSLARIARALNDTQVPPPSAADPDRNPHRDGWHWQVPAVGPSWPTPATPAARSGTASAPTTS